MTTLDWLLLALVTLAAVAAIRRWRKKGSCGCSGDCRHCAGGCPKKDGCCKLIHTDTHLFTLM